MVKLKYSRIMIFTLLFKFFHSDHMKKKLLYTTWRRFWNYFLLYKFENLLGHSERRSVEVAHNVQMAVLGFLNCLRQNNIHYWAFKPVSQIPSFFVSKNVKMNGSDHDVKVCNKSRGKAPCA